MTKEEFKKIREEKSLTQEEVAKLLRVEQSQVSDWELGENKIPLNIEKDIEYLQKLKFDKYLWNAWPVSLAN